MNPSKSARLGHRRSLFAVVTLLSLLVAGSSAMAQDPPKNPRVIVLGFDGVDHGLVQRFMDEGHLPHLAELSARGSFDRLETTNPAESAVSWSTFGRGLNPGNTNLFGFVSRKHGTYMPDLRFMKLGEKPLSEADPEASTGALAWALILASLVVGLAVAVFATRVAGLAAPLAGLLGLLLAVGAGAIAWFSFGAGGAAPPATVPTLLPVAEGRTLWHRLGEAGTRVKGFLVPMATPIEPIENGQMSGGLGVPDVAGRPIGSFCLFSTSATDVPAGSTERLTGSKGKVIRLVEHDGKYVADIPGPKDWARAQTVEKRLSELRDQATAPGLSAAERAQLRNQRAELQKERADGFEATLPLVVRRAGADQVEVEVGGLTSVVAAGQWSDWLALRFPLDWPFDSAALTRFRVIDAGDEIRLFFPSLGYDPREIPEHMGIEYPPGFSRRVAEDAGLYDTTGWACITNPLKDVEISEEVFLEQIRMLTTDRSRVVYSELAKDDYDFFFAMFGETDRIQHLMFRLFDEQNPMYDAELAAKYGSAILDVYKAMDEIVGEVMRRFLDDRTHLLIVSDHGFTSFRRQMSLNTWLIKEGYLVPTRGGDDPATALRRLPVDQQDYLLYMDKKRSRAFALGLGKIYINLEGREASGIVASDQYEALCTEITEKLLALRDPVNGQQVVRKVWRPKELYSGPYTDTDADLYLGFAKYYRVSWATTTGGFTAEVIEDNDSKWSGDHASNDPEIVPGVLFSSRPLAPSQRPRIVDMAPTILALFGAPSDGTDGRALTFR